MTELLQSIRVWATAPQRSMCRRRENLLGVPMSGLEKKGLSKLTRSEQKENIVCRTPPLDTVMTSSSSSPSQLNLQDADELEAAVDQAIAACDGNLRATIRALILANDFLESEVSELMKAVSHAYVRGRFQSYSG
jgi:hypothetical protein